MSEIDRYNPPASRKYMGKDVRVSDLPAMSKLRRGIFESATDAARQNWPEVRRRWSSLLDDESNNFVPEEEFKEAVGDLPVVYDPRMTRTRMEYQILEAEREAYMSQFESRPVAEFVGAMAPWMLDPVNVATYPVGGKAMMAARRAKTLGQTMRHSARGAAQVGIASSPIEVGVQATSMGELRADYLLMSTLAPVPFMTGMASGGHFLRRAFGRGSGTEGAPVPRRDQQAIAQGIVDGDIQAAPFRMTAEQAQDAMGVRAPAFRDGYLSHRYTPDARLKTMFSDYDGGAARWVRELAEGNEKAFNKARTLNIDPDSPVIANYFRKMGERTRQMPRRAKDIMPEALAFHSLRMGQATAEQVRLLKQRGVLGDAYQAARAQENPRLLNPDDLERIRNRNREVLKTIGEGEVYPEFRMVMDAVMKPRSELTPDERALLRDFNQQGVDGVYERAIRMQEAELDQMAPGSPERAQAYENLNEMRSRYTPGAREDLVDPMELMGVLEAAGMESPAVTPPMTRLAGTGEDVSPREAVMREAGGMDELSDYARRMGVDADEVDNLMNEIDSILIRC